MLQPSMHASSSFLFLFSLLLLLPSQISATKRSTINPSSQVYEIEQISSYPNYKNMSSWEISSSDDFVAFLDSNYGILFANLSSSSFSSSFHPPSPFSDIGGLFSDPDSGLFGVFYSSLPSPSSPSSLFLATIDPLSSAFSLTNISLPPLASNCSTTKSPTAAFSANGNVFFTFCNLILSVTWDGADLTENATYLFSLAFEIDHGRSWSAYNLVFGLGYFTAQSPANETIQVVVIDTQIQKVANSFILDKSSNSTNSTHFVGPIISTDPATGQVWLMTSANVITRFTAQGSNFTDFVTQEELEGIGVDSRSGECYAQWYLNDQAQSFILPTSQNDSSPFLSFPYQSTNAIYGPVFIHSDQMWGTSISGTPVFVAINFSDPISPPPLLVTVGESTNQSTTDQSTTGQSTTGQSTTSQSTTTKSTTSQPTQAPTPTPTGGVLTARVTQTIDGPISLFKTDKYGALLANLLSLPRANVSVEVFAMTSETYSVTTSFTLYTKNINQDHTELGKQISTAMQSSTTNGYFVQECSATLMSTSAVELLVLVQQPKTATVKNDKYTVTLALGVGFGLGVPLVGLSISYAVYRRRRQSYKVGNVSTGSTSSICAP